ncbi:glutamate--tRNA ligase family protein [Mucilaginibacter calamicampi]|uniref:Glutamate--tRNA ligase family protein n=1 Tax=Mucilaginibacter calamicampi TaxID=1302352 RepID=A0ABW2Z0N7_9SPHI
MGKQFKLTRIAPTPSGYLHLGNAYSFALTAAIANQTGAEILLRIDDLDRERTETAYVNDIFETLSFLNIAWQRGPSSLDEYINQWSQLLRLSIYQPALDKLKQSGNIFACLCSRKQLQTAGYECNCAQLNVPLETAGAAWRILTDDRVLFINTLTGGTINLPLPADMKNFIVRKKDGYTAYQLTSLMDDIHFDVDLIVRGEDLWPSTIAQHYLAAVLDINAFNQITFHHHKLLLADSDAKLSKSTGATSIQHLRNQGLSSDMVYDKLGQMLTPKIKLSQWADLSYNF